MDDKVKQLPDNFLCQREVKIMHTHGNTKGLGDDNRRKCLSKICITIIHHRQKIRMLVADRYNKQRIATGIRNTNDKIIFHNLLLIFNLGIRGIFRVLTMSQKQLWSNEKVPFFDKFRFVFKTHKNITATLTF